MPGESFEAKRGSVGSVLSDDSMPLGLQKKLHVAQKQQQQQQPIKVSALSMSTITSTSGFESMIKSPPPLSLTLGMGSEPASVPATNVPVRQRPMSQMMAPPVTTPQLRMGGVGKMAPNSQANPPFNAGNSGSDGSMRQLPFQQKPAVGLPVAGTPMSESYATPVTSTAEAGIMGRMPGMHGSATQSPYHVSDVGGFRPPASSGRPIPPARYSTQFMTVANSPAGMIPVYQTQGPPSQQQIQQQMGQHQRQHPMSPPVMYATPVSHSLPGSFPVPGVDKRASQPVAEVTQQSLAQSIENLKVDAAEPAGEGGNGDYDVQDSNPVNPEVVSSPSHADQPELNRQSMMSVESRSSTMEHQPTTEMLARKSALPTKLEPMGALQVEDETTKQSMRDFPSIASVLQSRATNLAFADARAFSVFDNRLKEVSAISYQDLYFRALKLSQILKVRTANIQDPHVALLFKSFEMSEFIISLFGCFLAGVVAVPISTSSHQPLDEVTEINFMLSHSRVCVVVTSDFSIRILSKAFMSCNIGLPKLDWIKVNEIGLASPKKASDLPSALENGVELAYIEYTKNGSHELKAVLMNHTVIMNQCHLMKSKLNSVKADTIGTYLETRTGIGLLYSVFYNIFIGSHSIFFPYDICMLPGLWPISMSRFNVDVALAEPTGLVSMLSTLQQFPAKEHLNLSGIHTLFVQSQWPSAHFFYDLADALVPLGLKSQDIILPLFGLAEFGGCLFSMAQHAKADSPGLRNVVLERHALSESRVQILRTNQSGTGFKSPDLGDRSVLAALSITESGTLFDQGKTSGNHSDAFSNLYRSLCCNC